MYIYLFLSISDLEDAKRKVDDENAVLKQAYKDNEKLKQQNIDEYNALNTTFEALQRKLKSTQSENDRLVCNRDTKHLNIIMHCIILHIIYSVLWTMLDAFVPPYL